METATSPGAATQRESNQAIVDAGVILLADRVRDPVRRGYVIVQPPEIPVNRRGIDMREVEVIEALVRESTRDVARSCPLRCRGPAKLRVHNGRRHGIEPAG